jgi:hypothetical protein
LSRGQRELVLCEGEAGEVVGSVVEVGSFAGLGRKKKRER